MKPAPAPPKPMVASSPGRSEKLPAPGLARLLIGKTGNRSRSRSVSRSKSTRRYSSSSSMQPTEPGEPTSPKVTCIGQVRIRKKNKNKNKNKSVADKKPKPKTCRCVGKPFLCSFFYYKPTSHKRSLWKKWGKKFNEVKYTEPEDPVKSPPLPTATESSESEDEDEDQETKNFVSSAPNNALLLMRCRSAPHNRSSALSLNRFAVSPIPASESSKEDEVERREEVEEGRESLNENGSEVRFSNSDVGPVGLKRCKSEPAKTAAKMVAVVAEERRCNFNGSEGRMVVDRMTPQILLH